MRLRYARTGLAAALAAGGFSACSLKTLTVRRTADIISAGAPSFRAEPDPALAREAAPAQLKLLEALLESDPGNPGLLSALAEGFVGYAFLFAEDDDPDRAAGLYRRGALYALRLAARNPALAGLGTLDAEGLAAALTRAGRADIPALYWAAYGWSGWANLAQGDPEALAAMPKAARLMERVLAFAPEFEHGGPDLFLGVYYAARPRIAGGDPVKAREHFEAALGRSGGRYLTAKLLYARFYAVAVLDEELFRRLLGEVLAAPEGPPETRLADSVARSKAKKLLERANDLF